MSVTGVSGTTHSTTSSAIENTFQKPVGESSVAFLEGVEDPFFPSSELLFSLLTFLKPGGVSSVSDRELSGTLEELVFESGTLRALIEHFKRVALLSEGGFSSQDLQDLLTQIQSNPSEIAAKEDEIAVQEELFDQLNTFIDMRMSEAKELLQIMKEVSIGQGIKNKIDNVRDMQNTGNFIDGLLDIAMQLIERDRVSVNDLTALGSSDKNVLLKLFGQDSDFFITYKDQDPPRSFIESQLGGLYRHLVELKAMRDTVRDVTLPALRTELEALEELTTTLDAQLTELLALLTIVNSYSLAKDSGDLEFKRLMEKLAEALNKLAETARSLPVFLLYSLEAIALTLAATSASLASSTEGSVIGRALALLRSSLEERLEEQSLLDERVTHRQEGEENLILSEINEKNEGGSTFSSESALAASLLIQLYILGHFVSQMELGTTGSDFETEQALSVQTKLTV